VGRVRRALVNPDNPASVSARLRGRRWDLFHASFPELTEMRVLDLGGSPRFWRTAPARPASVTTVNLTPADDDEPWLTHVVADACESLGLGQFDLVFSNSLIEHVGGHYRRQQLADVVISSAPWFWVQTPYRYFPVEPHFVVPAMQFMPLGLRTAIASRWHAGPQRRSALAAEQMVQSIELIGIRQLRSYFPHSRIVVERVGGLPKSIVATQP
jgi:hypothetical protein